MSSPRTDDDLYNKIETNREMRIEEEVARVYEHILNMLRKWEEDHGVIDIPEWKKFHHGTVPRVIKRLEEMNKHTRNRRIVIKAQWNHNVYVSAISVKFVQLPKTS